MHFEYILDTEQGLRNRVGTFLLLPLLRPKFCLDKFRFTKKLQTHNSETSTTSAENAELGARGARAPPIFKAEMAKSTFNFASFS